MSTPPFRTLPELLRSRANTDPDRVALMDVDGTRWTHAHLEAEVRAWMRTLHRAGVQPGDHVISLFPTSPTIVAVWMAIARLGAIEVPVNTAHHGEVLASVIGDSTASVAAVHSRWIDRFDEPAFAALTLVSGHTADTPGAPEPEDQELAEHDIATVVFTSGTSGRSKGVLIPWRQMHSSAVWCIPLDEAAENDHWYVPLPMFHVSGKISVFAAALTGACAITRDRFSTSRFWADVRNFAATTALLPGSAARYLESAPARDDDADNPLRNVFVAPFPRDRETFARRFGVRLTTAFNMTEVSCPITAGWHAAPDGSCGRARPGMQVAVVDELDRPVKDGTVGELVVRSESPWELMAGYLGAPQATCTAWRNLWFHTGDRCWRDENGFFYFVDRAGDAIRRRGENVSSAEVEAVLAGHPEVDEAAVVGVSSEWGEHDIKAYVLPKPGCQPSAQGIAAYAEQALPKFMVPRYTVVVDELPRTHTQRIRKVALRNRSDTESIHDRGY